MIGSLTTQFRSKANKIMDGWMFSVDNDRLAILFIHLILLTHCQCMNI